MSRPLARPASALCAGVVLAAALLPGAPLAALTNCLGGACTACAPTIPGVVTTYIDDTDFPAGASVPIKYIDPNDGLHHRFVATQEGAILVWNTQTHTFNGTPFLDLRFDGGGSGLDKVNYDAGERGLLSMAFPPDYKTTGRFYVYYTSRPQAGPPSINDGAIVVERYQRSVGDPDVANTARTLLFHINHGATNHNGGNLEFGPDGLLYISTGDGGGGCDGDLGINGDGQLTTTLLGKMLRIDPTSTAPVAPECGLNGANYTVPSDNPYAGGAGCNEVWLRGLRNPFRFTFDRTTGDFFIGDVGQDNYEEYNLRAASTVGTVNYGWPCREGCDNSSTAPSSCGIPGCPVDPGTTCVYPTRGSGFTDPFLCHSNPGGWSSAMGGYRYRGAFVPSMAARYLYSDAGAGQIWVTTALDVANPGATTACCWDTGNSGVYGFAEDHLGEVYVVNGGQGRVDCIATAANPGCYWAGWAGFFEDGFETGNTSLWSTVVP